MLEMCDLTLNDLCAGNNISEPDFWWRHILHAVFTRVSIRAAEPVNLHDGH